MRLADRQGLLTGQLNAAASFGLQILMMLDAHNESSSFWRQFRALLGASHPEILHRLFPDVFDTPDAKATSAEEIDRQATTEDGGRDFDRIDQSQIRWDVPQSDAERDDLERFLASADLTGTHTISANDLEGGENPWL